MYQTDSLNALKKVADRVVKSYGARRAGEEPALRVFDESDLAYTAACRGTFSRCLPLRGPFR
jgi:hypothetical protein